MPRPAFQPLQPLAESEILGYNVLLVAGFMTAESNALLRAEAKINTRQYIALRNLRAQPDLGSGELARRLFITAQSAGPLLAGLEQLGYIERAETNGQKLAVRLTTQGEDAVAKGDRVIAGLEQEHREGMAPGEAALLNDLLKKLMATLRRL